MVKVTDLQEFQTSERNTTNRGKKRVGTLKYAYKIFISLKLDHILTSVMQQFS